MATANAPLLVADDDMGFLVRVRDLALDLGFDPHCANTHAEASTRVKSQHFAFAIIELRLAEGFALDLLAKLTQRNPNVSVIIVTRYPSAAAAVAAIRGGAREFLVKPVEPAIVLAFLTGNGDAAPLAAAPPMSLAKLEWEYISAVLVECQGNISQAARMLGLHRQSLQRKLNKLPPSH